MENEFTTKLEGHYYKNGKFDDNLNIAMRYFDEMNPGDLILLHDKNMKFYVCVVLDEPIKINQGALYFEANVTCNRKVEFLSKAINEEELRNLGVEPSSCIARHTIEKMSSSDKEQLENYIINHILHG